MKKRILSFLLIISIMVCSAVSLSSCETAALDTPVVQLDGCIARWDLVNGATGYEVGVNGITETVSKTTTSYVLEDGDVIMVRAKGSLGATSSWSSPVKYVKNDDGGNNYDQAPTKLPTPVIAIDVNGFATWGSIEGVTEWGYKLNGVSGTLSTNGITLNEGDTLQVKALGDGVTTSDSDWSAANTYLDGGEHAHVDDDDNGECDTCYQSVIVILDFYAINDLHGKFCDTDTQPGVDELSTYLKERENIDDNVIVLSSGDMWQGSAESSLTFGAIMTDWMNEIGIVSMTLGNHEYDWGAEYIRQNLEIASFPFLAINLYDTKTGERVDYATPSVVVEESGIKIGIIGAMGDCKSSILAEMVTDVEFKVGSALTALVKAESDRLRSESCDVIVLSYHEGIDGYDTSLSAGYVDVVFEGHTHSAYIESDSYGVYHLQGGGENSGITHAELCVNSVTGNVSTQKAEVIKSSVYAASNILDDPATEAIEEKYRDTITKAYTVLGKNSSTLSDAEVEKLVAELYYEAGVKRWGAEYDIVLGGGFLRTRTPYNLAAGDVTYADLLSLLPFNNQLVLCSVSGAKLLDKFINTSSTDYYIYPEIPASSISRTGTYYIVVDTYTSSYSPNGLTEKERYDSSTFARDLLAEYIEAGGLVLDHTDYTLTSIPDFIAACMQLNYNDTSTEKYYVKGKIISTASNFSRFGNCYIEDEDGNQLFVYGINDDSGNSYQNMSDPPVVGDTVILYGAMQYYQNSSSGEIKVEMVSSILIEKS